MPDESEPSHTEEAYVFPDHACNLVRGVTSRQLERPSQITEQQAHRVGITFGKRGHARLCGILFSACAPSRKLALSSGFGRDSFPVFLLGGLCLPRWGPQFCLPLYARVGAALHSAYLSRSSA